MSANPPFHDILPGVGLRGKDTKNITSDKKNDFFLSSVILIVGKANTFGTGTTKMSYLYVLIY